MGRETKMLGRVNLVCNLCNKLKILAVHPNTAPTPVIASIPIIQKRNVTNKHYLPKWRRHRAKKVFRIPLPDYDKLRREGNMNPSDMRKEMKKQGNPPPRTFQERPIVISSTG